MSASVIYLAPQYGQLYLIATTGSRVMKYALPVRYIDSNSVPATRLWNMFFG